MAGGHHAPISAVRVAETPRPGRWFGGGAGSPGALVTGALVSYKIGCDSLTLIAAHGKTATAPKSESAQDILRRLWLSLAPGEMRGLLRSWQPAQRCSQTASPGVPDAVFCPKAFSATIGGMVAPAKILIE
jgi:hypothetical protein